MSNSRTLIGILVVVLITGALGLGLAASDVAWDRLPLRLTALAVDLGTTWRIRERPRSNIVEIRITGWSSDTDRQALLNALDQGPDKLLAALQEAKPVGTIRTPDQIGWDLHYAHATSTPDGGRRIFIATDRRIGFWEATNLTRSLDYPFTLIEIRLDAKGHGEGRMLYATKISKSRDGGVEIENYSSEPVLLQSVQVQRR